MNTQHANRVRLQKPGERLDLRTRRQEGSTCGLCPTPTVVFLWANTASTYDDDVEDGRSSATGKSPFISMAVACQVVNSVCAVDRRWPNRRRTQVVIRENLVPVPLPLLLPPCSATRPRASPCRRSTTRLPPIRTTACELESPPASAGRSGPESCSFQGAPCERQEGWGWGIGRERDSGPIQDRKTRRDDGGYVNPAAQVYRRCCRSGCRVTHTRSFFLVRDENCSQIAEASLEDTSFLDNILFDSTYL